MLFKINEYVIYNSTGVYKIIDIKKEKDLDDQEVDYYVLEPAYDNNNLTIKTPVHNNKIVMRRIITKDDVSKLIASMPLEETIWIDDNRARLEKFRETLRTGESEDWIKLIKTLYQKRKERTDIGKKLWKVDEEIMKAAEKNLFEEFATVLNISPDEVSSYIMERVEETTIA